jgi:hypothetical protein
LPTWLGQATSFFIFPASNFLIRILVEPITEFWSNYWGILLVI